jgi:hypothetical protein
VIRFSHMSLKAGGGSYWVCECSCEGKQRLVPRASLRRGISQSCGCLCREASSLRLTTHGMVHSPEHRAWAGMKFRCNPKNKDNPKCANWAGRGITVCKEWCGPEGFHKWYFHIGPRPTSEHSHHRIDNDGNYEPGNVKWATKEEQVKGRRQFLAIENYSHDLFLKEAQRRGLALAPLAA